MDIYVYRTTDSTFDGSIRQFNSLDECISTLIKETHNEEYVVTKGPSYYKKMAKNPEWIVGIYDDYRE